MRIRKLLLKQCGFHIDEQMHIHRYKFRKGSILGRREKKNSLKKQSWESHFLEKKKLDFYFILHIKINSKWNNDLYVKLKTKKYL